MSRHVKLNDNAARLVEPAEMTAEQLAEAKRYGHISLICDLARQGVWTLAYLALRRWCLAAPVDRWLAGPFRATRWRLMAIFALDDPRAHAGVVPTVGLLGLRGRASLWSEPAVIRRLAGTLCQADGLTAGFGLVLFVPPLPVDLVRGRLVVAGRGGGLLPGQRDPGPADPGA